MPSHNNGSELRKDLEVYQNFDYEQEEGKKRARYKHYSKTRSSNVTTFEKPYLQYKCLQYKKYIEKEGKHYRRIN